MQFKASKLLPTVRFVFYDMSVALHFYDSGTRFSVFGGDSGKRFRQISAFRGHQEKLKETNGGTRVIPHIRFEFPKMLQIEGHYH